MNPRATVPDRFQAALDLRSAARKEDEETPVGMIFSSPARAALMRRISRALNGFIVTDEYGT